MKKVFALNAQDELTEHFIYGRLARMERNPENRAALEKLSAQEHGHYEFWKGLLPSDQQKDIRPRWYAVWIVTLLRMVFGVTFITKFMEAHEKGAVGKYEEIMPAMPEPHRARFREIIEDEKVHESTFISQLKERRVSYIGFIVLGLADAIVEITGVHAGFLGVTGSTLIAGIAGVIVGFAASISMGSASYLQAKQEHSDKSPVVSGFATWASYFCSVIFLALPYFLIRTMVPAFIVSTLIGVLLVATFTFYGAVVFERTFWREFSETVGLMLATALLTYILGAVVGDAFHINPNKF